MKIDRHNYEEYFILYLDNELADADRRMVESFIELHPDLKEELEILSQFKLQPDTELVYTDKDSLLKPGTEQGLSSEQLLLYLDGELDPEQSKELQQQINGDIRLQQQFALLQRTKLQPELISFPDKSVLFRKTAERARIISVRWYRVAAAVLLFLLAGTTIVLLNNRKQNGDSPEVAKTVSPSIEKAPVTDDIQKESLLAKDDLATPGKEISTENDRPVNNTPVSIRDIKKEPIVANISPSVTQPEKQVKEILTNNLPEPENNRNVIAQNEIKAQRTIDPETNFSTNAVTSLSPQPLNIVQVSLPVMEEDTDQEPTGGKKNKLRGIFRKVTRTFEKRTNIDATDNDERLLVAGLAIKLK